MRVTLITCPPKAVISDTRVLKFTPMEMIQFDIGDILEKHFYRNVRKLSALVSGEHFCQKVYNLIYEAVVTAAIQELTAMAPGEAQMLEMVKRIGLDYNDFVKLYGQKKIDDEFLRQGSGGPLQRAVAGLHVLLRGK